MAYDHTVFPRLERAVPELYQSIYNVAKLAVESAEDNAFMKQLNDHGGEMVMSPSPTIVFEAAFKRLERRNIVRLDKGVVKPVQSV